MTVYHIHETIWRKIYHFLRCCKYIHLNEHRLRIFIEAVWYVAKTGCQWRLLPSEFGEWNSVYKRYKRWVDKGIWKNLFESVKIMPDMQEIMIDGTIIRAHTCAAGYAKHTKESEALGKSRGGFSTKIHAVVDALGNPLKLILTGGHRNEITQAQSLLGEMSQTLVIADKGYDSNAFLRFLENRQCEYIIPPRQNRKYQREYDKHFYTERHLIECFFGKIKHFRRIFSRFDKSAASYLGFLHFVSTLIWLR